MFVIVGFAFKVSAVPFHTWAPDTYEGAPTPVTAFLAVASKAAGFVALLELIFVGFYGRHDVWMPLMWVLAAVTMTVGNLIALRQTNVVRMLAYSGIAQAGYILAPLAIAGANPAVASQALRSVVIYLLLYAGMNLGAFAVVMAVARKTRSGEISSFGGLFQYAPGLTVAMTIFLFSLAGIPPAGGWFAKLGIFQALVAPGTFWGYLLAIVVAVNSVDRLRLLRPAHADDVDGRGARRRRHADPGPRGHHRGAGHHRRRDHAVRRGAGPAHPLHRPGHPRHPRALRPAASRRSPP